MDYSQFWVDYRDRPEFDELDRLDQQIGFTLFFRVLPKTSILGEYDHQWIRYDQDAVARDRDSDSNKFKVGLKGDLTEKTTLLGKVGYEFKDYDNPARDDWRGLIVELEAIYKYREPSQVRLFAARANVESTFEGNNFFVATYGGVELRHQIRPRLLLVLTGLIGSNDYPETTTVGTETKERLDRFYEMSAALRYQIRQWLAVEGRYDRLVRDSNFSDFDYTNNRVRATVSLTF
ncbi:MAG: outer membrane beta-barrel protein [Candidatus Rokubacteria bacterium]|nr:outer membrane beta-barrel protein [Candidatus Rokubacteria bacterium]